MVSTKGSADNRYGRKRDEEEEQQGKAAPNLTGDTRKVQPAQPAQKAKAAEPKTTSSSLSDVMRKAQEQGARRTAMEYAKKTNTTLVQPGEMTLPENMEKHRETLEKNNAKGQMGNGTTFGYANNAISVDTSSIKDVKQLAYFGTTLSSDEDRLAVYENWAKNNGMNLEDVLYQAENIYMPGMSAFDTPQSAQGTLNLVDAGGNSVDLKTADFATIVNAARNTPDEDSRENQFKWIEAQTRDKSSRFYGESLEGVDTSYRNGIEMPENDYKDYRDSFDARFAYDTEGSASDNLRTYIEEYDAINAEDSGLTGLQKYWYTKALNDAFVSQTGFTGTPDADAIRDTLARYDAAMMESDAPEDKQKAEKGIKAFFSNAVSAVGNFFSGKEEEATDEAETEKDHRKNGAQPTEVEAATQGNVISPGEAMPAEATPAEASGESNQATGRWIENMPGMQKQGGKDEPGYMAAAFDAFSEEIAPLTETAMPEPGSVNMAHDPVRAVMGYVYTNRGNELDDQTRKAVNDLVGSSKMAKVVLGLDYTDSATLFDKAQDDPFQLAKANVALRNYLTGNASGEIGSTLGGYYAKIQSGDFPDELRDDALGVLLEIGVAAEEAYKRGEISFDASSGILYEEYLKANPAALDNLRGVFRTIDEMHKEERDRQKAAANDAQAQLETSQARMRSGYYTQDDYDRVLAAAPIVTTMSATEEDAYLSILSNIRMAKTASYTVDDGWFNDKTAAYMQGAGLCWDIGAINDKVHAFTQSGGLNGDQDAIAAMEYKDTLCGFAEAELLNDVRVAQSLGYESLDAYYEKQGGFNIENLFDRAAVTMEAYGASLSEEDMAAAKACYTGTGEGVGVLDIAGAGAVHGTASTAAELLETIWSIDASLVNRSDAIAARRQEYVSKFTPALASWAYTQDMLKLADSGYLPSEEAAQSIRDYIASGEDVFQMGLSPEGTLVGLGAAKMDKVTESIGVWAQENMTPKQGKAFEIVSSTVSTGELQAMSTAIQLMTGSAAIGTAMSFGAGAYAQEARTQLAKGRSFKQANAMGMMHAATSTLAEMGTSGKLSGKIFRATGLTPAIQNGVQMVGDVGAAKVLSGMIKAFGKGAAEMAADELVKDELKDNILWQFAEGAGNAMMDGAGMLQAIGAGLSKVDVVGTIKDVVNGIPEGAIYMSPMIFMGGLSDAWSSTRRSVQKLAATGTAEAAKEFVQAMNTEMQNPKGRSELNRMMDGVHKGQIAAGVLATDEEIRPIAESAQKASEQMDSHKTELENSQTRAQQATEAYFERGETGDVEGQKRALAEIANASQGISEHQREYEQKKIESDSLNEKAVSKAMAKADGYVNAEKQDMIRQMSELAPQIYESAQQAEEARLQQKIDEINEQLQQEFEKGDAADYGKIEQLSTQAGTLELYLDDMQQRRADSGEAEGEAIRQETEAKLTEIAQAKEQHTSAQMQAVMETRGTRARLETENRELQEVFRSLRNDMIYVDEQQLGDILYETGAKSISEANRLLGTKLTTDRTKGVPLDGSYYADLKGKAPAYFREEWDAHPAAALVSLAQRRKLLRQDLADSKNAEKEAWNAYQEKAADSYHDIKEKADEIPPGHALSQFENESIHDAEAGTEQTSELLEGTTHEIHKQEELRKNGLRRIAEDGLKGTVRELMRMDRMSDADIATGYECLKILKKNGDLSTHAALSVKLGIESTRSAQELRAYAAFQKQTAATAARDTLEMADAYNKKKGRRKSVNVSLDADAQMSLGDTEYQPFMDAQVSRSTSDPAMMKLGSDVSKRSGLSVYWADMPDGVRAFFDREKGNLVINQKIGAAQGAYVAAIHEYTHFMEQESGYDAYADAILKAAYGKDYQNSDAMLSDEGAIRDEYAQSGRELTDELLHKELVAAATEQVLLGDEAFMRTLFERGNGGVAVRMLSGMDSFLRKRKAKGEGKGALGRYKLIESARSKMQSAIHDSGKWKAETRNGEAQLSLVGRTEDGKGIYQSNFAPNTPKSVKINRLVDLWQNVWSQNPIELDVVGMDGQSRKITANFDPDYDPTNQTKTDLGKVVHSKNGSSGDRTITLNLADDLHDMAREVTQVDNEEESGKVSPTHDGVKEWHYFSNDFVYRDENGDKPMTLWLDLKERDDGGWVYQLYARKTKQKKDDQLRSPDGSRGRSEAMSSSDTIVPDNGTDVNNYDMPDEPQLSLQVERQSGNGDRQQAISDPTTYDRISAEAPEGNVDMREQPEGAQRSMFDRDLRARSDVNETVRKVTANIAALDQNVSTDNEWGLPLNPFQISKIKQYGLRGTKLPGLNYNKATTKQRMLCAILATPQDNRGEGVMTLTQQLDELKHGRLAIVTEADYNYILSQAAIVEGSETDDSGIPLNREGQQAYARMRDAQANIEPTSLGEKLSAWRFINLLSAPATTIKNIDGNLIIQQADKVSTKAVEWLDKQVAKKTGTRSIAGTTRAERKAGTAAAMQRGRDAFDDYFVAGTSTSRSRNYDVGGDGRVFQNNALEFSRNLINFCMDAPDQMFMEKTIAEEMAVLERIDAKIMDEESGEMRAMTEGERYEEAYRRASERFYHDDNAMTSIMNTIYQIPYVGTAARVLIPFVKTPSNVALRMFDYSPLGLAKSVLYDGLYSMNHNADERGVGADFDQRKFVMGVGRGMTGTAMTALGMILYNAGILSFGREDEENKKRRDVLGALGEPYSMYVNIGDTKYEIAFTLPATAGLSIGAGIAEKMKDQEGAYAIAAGILSDQFNQIFDNTYLSSLNDIFRGYEDGTGIATRLMSTLAQSYTQQMFSPAAMRAIAKTTDTYARDTASESELRQFINETIVQSWPGLRQTLPIKTDMTGDAMTQHKAYQSGGAWENGVMNWLDGVLSPTATYSDKDDAELIELLDLSYRTGETAFLPPSEFATKNSLSVTKTLSKKLKTGEAGYYMHLDDAQQRTVNQMYSAILFNGTGDMKYRKASGGGNYSIPGLRAVMNDEARYHSGNYKQEKAWSKMDDEERVKLIEKMKEEVKELTTCYAVRNYR